ncbi:MAG: transposase [Clostridia bacterium]|nr:transposase [Clostridia bacterium]
MSYIVGDGVYDVPLRRRIYFSGDYMDIPNRKPTRCKNFDYSSAGAYFITICTHNKQKILCDIVGARVSGGHLCEAEAPTEAAAETGNMYTTVSKTDIVGEGLCALPSIKLTKIGEIVDESIKYINNYKNISVDKYVIMPNHVHLIIKIEPNEIFDQSGGHGDPPLQVYNVIGRFKSFTDNKYNGQLWQRSFNDHIIRDEKDYLVRWNYIDSNPAKWCDDRYYAE